MWTAERELKLLSWSDNFIASVCLYLWKKNFCFV